MNSSYGAPWSAVDVILLPGIFFIAAWLFRFLAWNLQRRNKKSTGFIVAAWIAVAGGVYFAYSFGWAMFNPDTGYMYTMDMAQRGIKMKIAHYIVVALPILTIIAFLVWNRIERKLGRPISI